MSKLNIIQRREIEPLMLKACKVIKHYEKASNSSAFAVEPEGDSLKKNIDSICSQCSGGEKKKCLQLHVDAINRARQLGGSYIYLCQQGLAYWTSPFYSGERFAGSLVSGGVRNSNNNKEKIKSLAQMMLLCADQISGKSFTQKNGIGQSGLINPAEIQKNFTNEKKEPENISVPEMERLLLANLRRGDKEEGQKILVNLLAALYQKVKKNFQTDCWLAAFRLKALELAVLLSRAVADPKDIKENTSLDLINLCIKKIEESLNLKEITDALLLITERMSGKIFSFHGVRHFSAIRKAERFIWTHYTRKLSLREIAAVSGLSAPYFSTVFKEEMGENLSNYLNRLRVEKASTLLVTTEQSICDIARNCGFEDQSWFSKIFKNNTGFTPGKYRELGMGN